MMSMMKMRNLISNFGLFFINHPSGRYPNFFLSTRPVPSQSKKEHYPSSPVQLLPELNALSPAFFAANIETHSCNLFVQDILLPESIITLVCLVYHSLYFSKT